MNLYAKLDARDKRYRYMSTHSQHSVKNVFDFTGVVRGCGKQKMGVLVNLTAYYLAGIPEAFFFAFVCHLGGMVRGIFFLIS
jgi:Na+-driven multidrug efflux pump